MHIASRLFFSFFFFFKLNFFFLVAPNFFFVAVATKDKHPDKDSAIIGDSY
jgi:hypothetical protein